MAVGISIVDLACSDEYSLAKAVLGMVIAVGINEEDWSFAVDGMNNNLPRAILVDDENTLENIVKHPDMKRIAVDSFINAKSKWTESEKVEEDKLFEGFTERVRKE